MTFAPNPVCPDYFTFQQDYWLGLWCPAFVEVPFGKIMPLFTGRSGTLLFQCDLESGWHYDEIINVLEDTAKKYYGSPGLYFTSGWQGDIQAFQNYAREQGYTKTYDLYNLIYNQGDISGNETSRLIFSAPKDAAAFSALYQHCFGASDIDRQRVMYLTQRQLNKTRNAFFQAEYEGQIIGVIGCSWTGEIGYYHLLGVLPDFRGRGYSKQMVAYAVSYLRDQGCTEITCAVREDSSISLALQKSMGFEVFETWQFWMKTAF